MQEYVSIPAPKEVAAHMIRIYCSQSLTGLIEVQTLETVAKRDYQIEILEKLMVIIVISKIKDPTFKLFN